MSPDAWTFLGVTVTGLVTLLGIRISYGKTKESTDRIETMTEPTSNGFVRKLEATLARMEQSITILVEGQARSDRALLDHLTFHVNENHENGVIRRAAVDRTE